MIYEENMVVSLYLFDPLPSPIFFDKISRSCMIREASILIFFPERENWLRGRPRTVGVVLGWLEASIEFTLYLERHMLALYIRESDTPDLTLLIPSWLRDPNYIQPAGCTIVSTSTNSLSPVIPSTILVLVTSLLRHKRYGKRRESREG